MVTVSLQVSIPRGDEGGDQFGLYYERLRSVKEPEFNLLTRLELCQDEVVHFAVGVLATLVAVAG